MVIVILKGATVHDNTERVTGGSDQYLVILSFLRAKLLGVGRFVYLFLSVKLYIICVVFSLNCSLP